MLPAPTSFGSQQANDTQTKGNTSTHGIDRPCRCAGDRLVPGEVILDLHAQPQVRLSHELRASPSEIHAILVDGQSFELLAPGALPTALRRHASGLRSGIAPVPGVEFRRVGAPPTSGDCQPRVCSLRSRPIALLFNAFSVLPNEGQRCRNAADFVVGTLGVRHSFVIRTS
jgi:hypothetical protein